VRQRFIASARFLVPETPQPFVSRPALVDRLESTAAPLTLVVGSPGSGKTAVLGSWVAQRSAPTVWLTCDPTDADPVRFWSAFVCAVQRLLPDAGVDALARLDDEGCESPDAAASLASDCTGSPGLVLVVDDFHYAGPARPVMAAFVNALPRGVRLALASRRDPSLPVGRLRVQGRLLEIRDDDMRFGPGEARQLLANLQVDITDNDVGRLCELTEGWAAGLQLAALSLTTRPDAESLLQAFAATDRGLADFLVNEVLDQQPPEVEDFLMETSVLESFDGALCDAVTGRHDSAELLHRLREAHLFVIELDRQAGWYRYHHVLAAFLQGRLRARSHERMRRAHAAASRACAARGNLLSAVNHAMAADDVGAAFDLVRQAALARLDAEARLTAIDTLRAWLRQHGHHYLDRDPRLVLECCLILTAYGSPDDIELWLHRVQHAGPGPLEPASAALIEGVRGMYRLHQGDPVAALRCLDEVLRNLGDAAAQDTWVSRWPVLACQAHLWLDDPAAAKRAVDKARQSSVPAPILDAVRHPGFLAWAAVVEGELPEAEHQARLALEGCESLGLAPSNIGLILPHLALAAIAREHGEMEEAERLVAAATDAAIAARRSPTTLMCVLEQARLAMANRATDDALATLDAARRIMPAATSAVTDHIDRLAARIALDAGHHQAPDLIDRLLPTPHRLLLQARLELASSNDAARDLLDGAADAMTTRRLRVEHGLLSARARAKLDRGEALKLLDRTLRLAQPIGFLTTILDEGPDVYALLEALPTHAGLDRYVTALLDAARRQTAPPGDRVAQPLIEPLSDRELTALRYLASRLTYREIANELYISINTLKSHVKAIYRKLGASTREEAVQAARQIGLLATGSLGNERRPRVQAAGARMTSRPPTRSGG
jgi:LuxR family transcriptional regulator, maltose regulon positive regulatory protein